MLDKGWIQWSKRFFYVVAVILTAQEFSEPSVCSCMLWISKEAKGTTFHKHIWPWSSGSYILELVCYLEPHLKINHGSKTSIISWKQQNRRSLIRASIMRIPRFWQVEGREKDPAKGFNLNAIWTKGSFSWSVLV